MAAGNVRPTATTWSRELVLFARSIAVMAASSACGEPSVASKMCVGKILNPLSFRSACLKLEYRGYTPHQAGRINIRRGGSLRRKSTVVERPVVRGRRVGTPILARGNREVEERYACVKIQARSPSCPTR